MSSRVKDAAATRKQRSGFVWHMYHSSLLSYVNDYDWRVRDIKLHKLDWQVPERLKRFQFVKGKLPLVFQGVMDGSRVSREVEANQQEIEALHAKECKNCSWNGEFLMALDRMWLKRRKWYHRLWNWLRLKWYHSHVCNWPSWSHKWPWNDA